MIEGFSPGIIPDRELRAFDWQFSQDSLSVIYKKQSEIAGAESPGTFLPALGSKQHNLPIAGLLQQASCLRSRSFNLRVETSGGERIEADGRSRIGLRTQ